jgi:glycosyltransferase involved in cell wall biosynthesis
MSRIVFADLTSEYDGRSLERRPLGGTETSVIRLSCELAGRGHDVSVYTRSRERSEHEGVKWRSLSDSPSTSCDLFVAVQQPRLLGFVPHPVRLALWVLWQPNNLKHYKQIWRMWRYRPIPILMSRAQQAIYSPFLPPHREVLIPLGLPDEIRHQPPLPQPPTRRALFASNPSRNLHRLVSLWASAILPRVPDAVLDVYGVNGLDGSRLGWDVWEGSVLPVGLPTSVKLSVRIHPPVSRADLKLAMRQARVMPYFGHKSEAFCLTLAEAQALGLPAVVAPIAVLPERVIDGTTGFHCADEEAFANATVALLTDDGLWRRQHEAALALQQGLSWSDYADAFEAELL